MDVNPVSNEKSVRKRNSFCSSSNVQPIMFTLLVALIVDLSRCAISSICVWKYLPPGSCSVLSHSHCPRTGGTCPKSHSSAGSLACWPVQTMYGRAVKEQHTINTLHHTVILYYQKFQLSTVNVMTVLGMTDG